MQWNDVRALLMLLRGGSLSEAGRLLDMDRTTVSHRIKVLEKSLGTQLFVRARERLRPTAAAARLLPYAEKMEADAAALALLAAASGRRGAGAVKVATTEALAALLAAEGLLQLRQQHPNLVIELSSPKGPVDIAHGEADVALLFTALQGAGLHRRSIARVGFGLFAAPAYLRVRGARGRVRSPGALDGHDVLLPGGELSVLPEVRWLAARPGVRPVLRSDSMSTLVAAALAGQGLVPLMLPWGDRIHGLKRVLVLEAVPKQPVYLVSQAASRKDPAVQAVCQQITSILARSTRE